jgi:hypothetical protein
MRPELRDIEERYLPLFRRAADAATARDVIGYAERCLDVIESNAPAPVKIVDYALTLQAIDVLCGALEPGDAARRLRGELAKLLESRIRGCVRW